MLQNIAWNLEWAKDCQLPAALVAGANQGRRWEFLSTKENKIPSETKLHQHCRVSERRGLDTASSFIIIIFGLLSTKGVEWQWVITQPGHLQELLVSDFSHLHYQVCSQITISWRLLFSRRKKDMKRWQYERGLENNLWPQNRKRRKIKKSKNRE